jgi:hypothetical protein
MTRTADDPTTRTADDATRSADDDATPSEAAAAPPTATATPPVTAPTSPLDDTSTHEGTIRHESENPSPTPARALGDPWEETRPARAALWHIALDATRARTPDVSAAGSVGVRGFVAGGHALATTTGWGRWGPVGLGVTGASAPATPLGQSELQPTLVLGSVELVAVCVASAPLEACAMPRVHAGWARIGARSRSESVVATSADGSYVEAALALSLGVLVAPLEIALDVSLGWAEGLVAQADRRDVFTLAGPVFAVSLTLGGVP